MIKKVFRSVGKVAKPFVNFPHWMGWKQLSADSKGVVALAKSFFSLKKKKTIRSETFDEAKSRLKLTEENLSARQKTFLQMAIAYLVMGLLLLAYTVYVIAEGTTISGVILSLILTLSAFAMSYREHLWYFQMKQRRLGCTFKEWLAFILSGGRA